MTRFWNTWLKLGLQASIQLLVGSLEPPSSALQDIPLNHISLGEPADLAGLWRGPQESWRNPRSPDGPCFT